MKRNLIASAMFVASAALAQTPTYIVTDLGAVGGVLGQPFLINNRDLIAGTAVQADGSAHSLLWYKGWQLDIAPGLGGSNSIAFGANMRAQIVGAGESAKPDPHAADFCGFKSYGLSAKGATCLPYIWENGATRTLELLGGNNGIANMINAQGEVAGLAETAAPDPTCPPPAVLQFSRSSGERVVSNNFRLSPAIHRASPSPSMPSARQWERRATVRASIRIS